MSTTANSHAKASLPRQLHGRHDVGRSGASRDKGWMTVDRPVPHLAMFFVVGIARAEDLPAEAAGELFLRLGVDLGLVDASCH